VHHAGKLPFFGGHEVLADARAFKAWLAPLRKCEWVVYAKRLGRLFAGPQGVLDVGLGTEAHVRGAEPHD
jgi:hypothetical protein